MKVFPVTFNKNRLASIEAVPTDTLPVFDIFATIEGEGAEVGKPTVFLRLAGCAFNCSWCDTKESLTPKHTHVKLQKVGLVISELDELLIEYPNASLKITGGEPMHYTTQIAEIASYYASNSVPVWLETSGLILDSAVMSGFYGVSFDIKPPSAGDAGMSKDHLDGLYDLITGLPTLVQVKAVVRDECDVSWLCSTATKFIEGLSSIYQDYNDSLRLVITPSWDTEEEKRKVVAALKPLYAYPIRIIPQIHKWLEVR